MTVLDIRAVPASGVSAVADELRALVGAFEPDDVFVFDAPGLWAEFSEIRTLASAAMTLLARKVEAACTWQGLGFRSAAEQLASVSGTTVTAATTMLETSKQLEKLPATAAVLRTGKLSQGKVEAIAAAATIAPEAEQSLLELAVKAPLRKVQVACLRARAGVDRDKAHARIRRERRLREFSDAEGAWNLVARGTPEAGAIVHGALEPIIETLFKAARADGRREPREAYAFDALVELARRASGAHSDAAADVPGKPRPKPTPVRFMALIRADLEALRRGQVDGDEICEITGLGPIPVRTARELLGDATLKLVLTNGVDVANVTHLGRSPTVAQQVALWWRSPGCTVEGCTRTQRLENDHELGWANTHRTCLDELDPLCSHDHDLKTYFGWALVKGKGPRPFVPPTDPRHPKNRPPPDP